MFSDPISDMLTRIRNASKAKKPEVFIPFSKAKLAMAHIFKREGYIEDAEEAIEGAMKGIKVTLKYKDGESVISNIERVSKPGRRLYVDREHLPVILNNLGIAIVSTSRGMMTNREAKKAGIGGEVICKIY